MSTPQSQKPLELILARNLLTSISTPAFLVDGEAAVVFYNEAAAALLGRSFEDVGRMSAEEWTQTFGPFDREGEPMEVDSRWRSRTRSATAAPPTARFRIRNADGERHRDRGERLSDRHHRPRLHRRDDPLLAEARVRTATDADARQGLGSAWLGAIAGAAHEPLRRQHVMRAADARKRRRAHPRRRHRHPHARPRAQPGRSASTSCSPICTSTTSRA